MGNDDEPEVHMPQEVEDKIQEKGESMTKWLLAAKRKGHTGVLDFERIVVVERRQEADDIIIAANYVGLDYVELPGTASVDIQDRDRIDSMVELAPAMGLPDWTIFIASEEALLLRRSTAIQPTIQR